MTASLEPYRPAFHFTPAEMWLNDPNGLVYFAGEYHLFYQFHPASNVWGPMHWGHAVSQDLVNWEPLPVALYPDENGMIFSGSAVIDWHNTTGFGQEAMVAIFTHHNPPHQSQSLAYSTDNGRTWAKYSHNPVIVPPNGLRDFRDPKVFWYGREAEGHWVMVIAAGTAVLFFTSPDLINWEPSSSVGFNQGATCGTWETPDLFQLPVDNGPEMRWVLAVAIGSCAPAGGSGVQYFIGDFDGRTFTNANNCDTVLWADYGADFYAPQSWSDAPDGRRVWLGWMNNWAYANEIPTAPWRGAMTIPRELSLIATAEGLRLAQRPVPELASLRGQGQSWANLVVEAGENPLAHITAEAVEIIAEFECTPEVELFGIRVCVGRECYTTVGYAVNEELLFVDRSHSGDVAFSQAFTSVHNAPLRPQNGRIRLHLLVDRSSVEVFANEGTVVMTEQIFPEAGAAGLGLFVEGGSVRLHQLAVWPLALS